MHWYVTYGRLQKFLSILSWSFCSISIPKPKPFEKLKYAWKDNHTIFSFKNDMAFARWFIKRRFMISWIIGNSWKCNLASFINEDLTVTYFIKSRASYTLFRSISANSTALLALVTLELSGNLCPCVSSVWQIGVFWFIFKRFRRASWNPVSKRA